MILPSLCCREKVPAAGQALQEQMHKGITELKRLASEPLGPEVTKKTEAAISYVDTTYQKLISTPAGGLWWQCAMLSWLDLKSPAMLRPSAEGAPLPCPPCCGQHAGFATLAAASFGLLQQVGCGGLCVAVAGPCTERQHEHVWWHALSFAGLYTAMLLCGTPWCPVMHADWRLHACELHGVMGAHVGNAPAHSKPATAVLSPYPAGR